MGGFVFHRADGCWLLRVIQSVGGHTCRRIHKFRGTLQLLSIIKHILPLSLNPTQLSSGLGSLAQYNSAELR